MRRLGCLLVLMMAAMAQSIAFATPPTVDKPGGKFRFLSLAEARAIALEHGSYAQPSLLFPGIGLDNSMVVPQQGDSTRMHVGCKPGTKGLVLVGIPRNPRPAEYQRNINQHLLNVENAYWNLYGSYWQLHSREQGLRFAYETWKLTKAQFKVGRLSGAAVAQAEGQYNLFHSQRLQALDWVLDNERQLRAILGMMIEDGKRLVPSDAPMLVEKKPDWKEGWQSAMKNRPELHMARKDLVAAKVNLSIVEEVDVPLQRAFGREMCAKTETLPFVRCSAKECDTDARSCLREAQLRLARAYLVLQDQELKTERFLGLYYRRMSSAYFQIKAARAQCEAFATQMKIRNELYRVGSNEPGIGCPGDHGAPVALDLLLGSQRAWAEALATEYNAIVTYNISICGWEYAKGDIMRYAHVRLGDNPSCGGITVSATERERKRTRQQVRRIPAVTADSLLHVMKGDNATAPSLAALWKSFPPLKEAELQTGLVEWKSSDLFSTRRGGVSP